MLNIIKASAGSGKTYTLALEYITLLLGEKTENGTLRLYSGKRKREYHRHILAVTFTNKATDEMKQRIVKELAVLAGLQPDSKGYMETLCVTFKATDKQVQQAAKRALTELLFDYSNFNVSTIDSFFQIILRTFAAEVELPYDYDIELNDDYALAVGVHDFLNLIRSDRKQYAQVLGWLKNFVTAQLQAGDSNWNPFKEGNRQMSEAAGYSSKGSGLFSLAGIINKETFRKVHTQMNDYLSDSRGALMLFQTKLEQQSRSLLDEIRRLIADGNRKFDDANYGNVRKTSGSLSAWLLNSAATDYIPDKNNIKTLVKYTDAFAPLVSKTKLKKGEPLPGEDFENKINEICKDALKRINKYMLVASITGNIYKLGLLVYINRCVSDFRNENNLILLSDTNSLLHDIIGEDDTPFIYERIGTSINNFLIDEFQDTSELQWHNMEPMLCNSLGDGHFNLIIGDEKQCIYRFRNSDPSLLQHKVGNTLKQWVMPGNDKSRNWRSSPTVVKFNNTFFTKMASELGLTDMYANVIQLYKPDQATEGYVRINQLSEFDEDTVSERVISLICDMIDRGYRQSDIAVLVDKNSQGATIIRNILEYDKGEDCRRHINVVSNESLLLCNSPAVRLVVSYMRYIALTMSMPEEESDTKQAKSFNERLHRLLRQYEGLLNKGITPGDALDHCFEHPDDRSEVGRDIGEFMPDDSEGFSLVSMVERIIERVSPEARTKENAFLQAFQDAVIDFSSRTTGTLLAFLRWWDRAGGKLSIASPEGVDAVNVMTIHKSKGLEFACVILPFATWDIGKLDDTLWFTHDEVVKSGVFDDIDESLIPPLLPVKKFNEIKDTRLAEPFYVQLKQTVSDCLNKTYVAFTRAVDELHIFTKQHSGSAGDTVTQKLDYYLAQFCNSSSEAEAQSLNVAYGKNSAADVATWVTPWTDDESGDTYYEAGSIANKQAEASHEAEPAEAMQPYHVVNRHDLAKYKLPDVIYTPEQERGILYHRIFSMIHSVRDVERVLRYCEVRYILPVDKTERDAIVANIRAMLTQSDEVKSWFAAGNRVYNERPIIDGRNRPRPDRVVSVPDGRTIVIDYKFGEPHHKSHSRQVKSYMELLRDAGFENVEGRIWYPFDESIVRVD